MCCKVGQSLLSKQLAIADDIAIYCQARYIIITIIFLHRIIPLELHEQKLKIEQLHILSLQLRHCILSLQTSALSIYK